MRDAQAFKQRRKREGVRFPWFWDQATLVGFHPLCPETLEKVVGSLQS